MADFSVSLAKTLLNEGGFADRRHTPTGEVVNRGITLDTLHRLHLVPTTIERHLPASDEEVAFVRSLDMATTAKVYHDSYWVHVCGDFLRDQALADKLFDLHVNTGQGVRLLQRAINTIHWPGVPALVEDNVMGQVTLNAVMLTNPKMLLGHCGDGVNAGLGLRWSAERYYRSIPDPNGDLEAWLRRLRLD